jgi:hypothetical protein
MTLCIVSPYVLYKEVKCKKLKEQREKRNVKSEGPYQNKSGALQGMLSLYDILPQRLHRRCKEVEY